MHFESKKKADNFIKFNAAEMISKGLKAPVRSYYCQLCGVWHVTSNPSVAAGERLDRRDKEIAQCIDQEMACEAEFKACMKRLEEMWDDYKFAIGLCDFSKATDVLNEIESEIPSHTKEKKQLKRVTAQRDKVATERICLNQLNELAALSKEEQHQLIDTTEDADAKEKIKKDLQKINSIRLVHDVLAQKENLIACNDVELVSEIVEKCRQYIKLGATGSKHAKGLLNKRLDEIMHNRRQRIINDEWGDWLFGPVHATQSAS